MKRFFTYIRSYILRGLLASIPIVLSAFAIYFIYAVIDKRHVGIVYKYFGFSVPGLGILLVLFFLFILGFVTSNVVGKQMLNLIEKITTRIPIVKTTYQVGKQLSLTLSLPEKQVFKQVVLVEIFHPGIWMIGFVTGTIRDIKKNENMLKVFIPKTPNPTSGWYIMIKESQTRNPGWTVEEAMKTAISGGIIGTQEIGHER